MNFADYTFLALGSNLGDREENIRSAIKEIRNNSMLVIKQSKVYESRPMANLKQANYLNMVVMIKESYSAEDLLCCLQEIEQKLGRQPGSRWSSRIIDIDIILQKNYIVTTPRLNIPHKDYTNRDFVLKPLSDIAPLYAPFGKSVVSMLDQCQELTLL